MATNRNRKTARRTPRGTNAAGIQKQINTDYEYLVKDYQKLFLELWQRPVTKFVLGGVALGAVFGILKKYPEVNTFVSENVESIRTKIDGVIHSRDELA